MSEVTQALIVFGGGLGLVLLVGLGIAVKDALYLQSMSRYLDKSHQERRDALKRRYGKRDEN